jgi:hypothetical protein
MRAFEQPLLAVQQLNSGITKLSYRPLMPEDFQSVKVGLRMRSVAAASRTYSCFQLVGAQHAGACPERQLVAWLRVAYLAGVHKSWVCMQGLAGLLLGCRCMVWFSRSKLQKPTLIQQIV